MRGSPLRWTRYCVVPGLPAHWTLAPTFGPPCLSAMLMDRARDFKTRAVAGCGSYWRSRMASNPSFRSRSARRSAVGRSKTPMIQTRCGGPVGTSTIIAT